jgi:hypothetical protein
MHGRHNFLIIHILFPELNVLSVTEVYDIFCTTLPSIDDKKDAYLQMTKDITVTDIKFPAIDEFVVL